MAITIATLIYNVQANTSGAIGGLNATDRAFGNVSSRAQSFGRQLSSVGQSLSIGLTAPLLLLGKQIIDIGFSYEKAMNTFQAVTRATAQEMSAAAAMAEKLGADMSLPATSAADAALAMTELAKGGFTAAQAMEAARGSLQLAAAAQVSEAQAATITANALNTFHLAATESVRVSDLLAAASNASSAEITDIAHSMQQAGSSAAALGIPIEDLVTSIGLMANAGIKGSDAGTSLKTMMAALTPSTEKAAGAMRALGIDAFDAQGNFVGLEAIIAQAAPSLAKMTTEQRAFAIEAAFGSDAQRAANIILGEGAAKFAEMGAAVGQSGAAAELAAAKTKGLSGAWDGFISQMETAGLKIFQQIAPMLEKAVRGLAEMVSGLATLNPAIVKFGIAATALIGSAGPIALLAGKLMTLGPAGAVTIAVIAGMAAMAGAYATNFGQMTSTVDSFAASFMRAMGQTKTETGAWGDLMTQTGIFVAQMVDIVLTGLSQIANVMGGIIRANIALMTGDFKGAFSAISEGFSGVAEAGEKFNERVEKRTKEMRIAVEQGAKGHMEYLRVINSEGGKTSADGYFNGYIAADAFGRIEKFSLGAVKGLENKLRSQGLEAGLAFGGALKAGAYSATHQSPFFIIHWLQDAADYAKNEAASEFGKAGTKMGDKLKEGFTAALGNINDFLGRALGGTGTISDSVFDILLRKFPEVAKELGAQATGFRETNKAIELYSVLLQSAAGKNEDFTLAVQRAFGAMLQTDRIMREGLIPSFANLGGAIQATTIITKEMGDAISKSVGSLAELTVAAKTATTAAQELADKAFSALGDRAAELASKLPDSWNTIIDAIVNGSGKVGSAVYEMANNIKGWAGDILGIVDTMPGKFGDMARKVVSTVDQWVGFANKVLAVLNRLNSSIPGSIGGIIEKIAGLFKKTQSTVSTSLESITGTVKDASGDWSSTLEKMAGGMADGVKGGLNKANGAAQSGMSNILGTLGKAASAAAGIMGGIMGFMGSRNQGKVMGVLGGAMSGMATGASIGAFFGPAGVGIGAGIGAAAGAILGLFGTGKSKEQKAAEEAAKQRASLDMQRAAADIMVAQMDGLKKGLELLEGLKTFSTVPTKIIKRFFNEIEMILKLFAEMAAKFKADSIEQSKALTEIMGGAFSALIGGADLINAIKGVATITDQNIADFISTTVKIIEKWTEAASQIEMQSAKLTGKISEKLKTSFEFLALVPDVIKGFAESVKVDDSVLDTVFATAQKIVQKMKEMSEAERGLELNKAGASAGIFASIFETTKGLLELFAQIAAYKPLEDSILNVVSSDLQKLIDWGAGLTATALAGITQFDTLGDAVAKLRESIGGAMSGINALTSGNFGSSPSSITANIQSGEGASFVRGGGSNQAASSQTTVIQNNNFQITMSLKDLEELATAPDRLERIERLLGKSGLGLAANS